MRNEIVIDRITQMQWRTGPKSWINLWWNRHMFSGFKRTSFSTHPLLRRNYLQFRFILDLTGYSSKSGNLALKAIECKDLLPCYISFWTTFTNVMFVHSFASYYYHFIPFLGNQVGCSNWVVECKWVLFGTIPTVGVVGLCTCPVFISLQRVWQALALETSRRTRWTKRFFQSLRCLLVVSTYPSF